MERLRRIADLWNWLPAFRAVAETEHLPTASEKLRVSPSALSRTIRLLEDHVGSPLFDRVGREIRLNANGAVLLAAARDAMRIVDDGLATIDGAHFAGPVHVGAVGVVAATFIVPAMRALCEIHPDLVPHIHRTSGAAAHPRILRGELDIAIHDDKASNKEVRTLPIGQLKKSIYAGRGHPLYQRTRTSLDEVLAHSFVAPTLNPSGTTPDGWPAHIERRIALHVTEIHIGIQVCQKGLALGVFPDLQVYKEVDAGDLFRVPLELIGPATVFASLRRTVGPEGRAEAALDAVQKQFVALDAGPPTGPGED